MMDSSQPEIAVALMRDLLSAFNRADIACCILRNHEFLIETAPFDNADVDLLISAADRDQVFSILSELGFSRTTESTVSFHIGYIAYPVPGFIFALDLHIDHPSWNDIPYANGQDILSSRKVVNGIPIPSDPHTVTLLTLHSILDKKTFKAKYVHILNALCTSPASRDGYQKRFAQILKPSLANDIATRLLQSDYAGLMCLRRAIIRALLGLRLNRWMRLLSCIWRSRWKRLRTKIAPPALLVALLGPDGAGKTTAINGVCRALEACGISVEQYYMGRWHSHILPLDRAAQTHGATKKAASENVEKNKQQPAEADPIYLTGRPVYRFIRDGIYLLEMFLRYTLRLYPALRKRGIVLTDRYAYDLLLDPNATWLLRRLIPSLYPRPHLCFLLHHAPEELHKRKQEQSLEEITRQVATYRAYLDRLNLIPVLSEGSDRVAHSVTKTILFAFYQRF